MDSEVVTYAIIYFLRAQRSAISDQPPSPIRASHLPLHARVRTELSKRRLVANTLLTNRGRFALLLHFREIFADLGFERLVVELRIILAAVEFRPTLNTTARERPLSAVRAPRVA